MRCRAVATKQGGQRASIGDWQRAGFAAANVGGDAVADGGLAGRRVSGEEVSGACFIEMMTADEAGEVRCAVEVARIEGCGMERQGGLDHGSVVGGEPGEDRLAGAIRMSEAAVAAHLIMDEAKGAGRQR